MNNKYLKIVFVIIFLTSIMNSIQGQDNSIALAAADTIHFSVDKKDGWQLFNSYVSNISKDSATLELIIQHANNINWKQEQYVGRIKTQSLIPSVTQVLKFNLLTDSCYLKVDNSGRCYLLFMDGALPSGDPFVFPLKVFYKL